jgi:tRNA(adenine34) deaminase
MQRRTLLTGGAAAVALAAVTARAERAAARSSPAQPDDTRFMQMAIDEAAKADFPFGAVIVRNGEVLARGRNSSTIDHDPTAHGEMVAIRAFLAEHGPDGLKVEGTTLYTSGEPCVMCMGAIIWCRIPRLVFAASVQQLSTKIGQIMISDEEIAAKTPFFAIDITGGVLADEALALFK